MPDRARASRYVCPYCKTRLPDRPIRRTDNTGLGLIGGSVLGAALGGPVGAVIGAIVGLVVGSESSKR